jgi:hypothetical protein
MFAKRGKCCPCVSGGVLPPPPDCDTEEFLVYSERFAGGTFSEGFWSFIGVETRYDEDFYAPNTLEIPFDLPPGELLTPKGSAFAGHYFLPEGTPTDQTPWQVQKGSWPFTELFVDWYEWYRSPFPCADGQKIFRAGYSGGGGPSIDFARGGICRDSILWEGGPLIDESQFEPIPSELQYDQWVRYQIYYQHPTSIGAADGRYVLWRDGSVLLDLQNLDRSIANTMDFFWIGGNSTWNGGESGSITVTEDLHRYIADIDVYSALPCNMVLP